jgi:hypothetical protein
MVADAVAVKVVAGATVAVEIARGDLRPIDVRNKAVDHLRKLLRRRHHHRLPVAARLKVKRPRQVISPVSDADVVANQARLVRKRPHQLSRNSLYRERGMTALVNNSMTA